MENKEKVNTSHKTLVSFDYAMKYLLKDKSDYDILESFISSILAVIGYPAIKIEAILDPESDRESRTDKRFILDILVKDTLGRTYLIEVDRLLNTYFAEKVLSSTARELIRKIKVGERALDVIKVFHISFFYFRLEEDNPSAGPIYHQKLYTRNYFARPERPLTYEPIEDPKHGLYTVSQLSPEYIYVSLEQFEDTLKGDIAEWLYMLKNSEIREECEDRSLQKASKKLDILKMSSDELYDYERYGHDMSKRKNEVETGVARGISEGERLGIEKGKAEGKAEGERVAKLETAKNMLHFGISKEDVVKMTGLSIEDLNFQ